MQGITDEQREQLETFAKWAAECVENIRKVFQSLCNNLPDIAEIMAEMEEEWLKQQEKRQRQIKSTRSGWLIHRDTRRKSQVLMNKPKFFVRKVIR
ncbi:hypothetical protein AWH48_12120 [Domibacillus aminovorans]|uniref:Uncharacterized protein n=1 Tax=Domibacillus aminovorans TaxID=29332 RepID=A0A177KJD8_9BACI|nr:hypothetical protein [Domibacillus aminovorans]OAH53096.1 hypothetical protein AWH48_12120 [Domibacillus aminovorans]